MTPETRGALFVLALSVIWKTLLLLTGWVDGFLGKFPLLAILAFLLIGMFRSMEARRKLTYPDGITFLPAFKAGMSVNALFSLLYSLFMYFYLFVLDTGFRSRFVNQRVADMVKEKTSPEAIEAWKQSTTSFPFEMMWMLFTFIGVLIIGTFYAAMTARMMARKYPVLAVKAKK
jgi:ABC-type antimicrobial peptide transport system permease subunit